MATSPVNLHGTDQHSRASSAMAKPEKLVGTLKTNIFSNFDGGGLSQYMGEAWGGLKTLAFKIR